MSRFVRASKVRHVYCQPSKPEEHYSNIRLSTATGDHNYIKANCTYVSVPVATGGGALAIQPLDKPGRFPSQPFVLEDKGAILDHDFNPFHDNIIATGSDSCNIKVFGIPPGGLTKNMSDPLVQLHKHQRKVVVLRFHPTAEHVLASGSADTTVKIWDIETGDVRMDLKQHGDLLQDVVWNRDGSVMATSCKDKKMRLIDPRSADTIAEIAAHDGSKTSKLTYLGYHGTLCSVGFTKQSKRQFKIWDPKKLDKPVCTTDIDQAAGVIMPFYDEDTNLLFLGGKGDGNIRYYEIVNDAPWQFSISDYRATSPCRGLAILPKRACDVMKTEVVKMMKLTSNSVEPLSFICPRKSDLFQEDLFPDCYAGKPALTSEEWWAGKNKDPILMSLDPEKRVDDAGGNALDTSKLKNPSKSNDVHRLHSYIDQLEKLLIANNIDLPEM
eukprot:CAMPEP_0203759522 /NCGR_PEP_ID=MMETSP0098-20131031/12565_1 /ASSEMBLY_ACC=CAM_ASM_000208 /TAXON_ID=96639 /ORGANISM=" , Strain NY0313808BC1" /LENGTH=439 /DNA_ID=CAMNT_0050652531 /DNA_START=104 /DNA_END=1423 /DNA_ORIENTATION=-